MTCSNAWSNPSTSTASSSPTPPTSCAHPWPPCGLRSTWPWPSPGRCLRKHPGAGGRRGYDVSSTKSTSCSKSFLTLSQAQRGASPGRGDRLARCGGGGGDRPAVRAPSSSWCLNVRPGAVLSRRCARGSMNFPNHTPGRERHRQRREAQRTRRLDPRGDRRSTARSFRLTVENGGAVLAQDDVGQLGSAVPAAGGGPDGVGVGTGLWAPHRLVDRLC